MRAWEESDAEALLAAFGDPETMRFWESPPRRDVAETAAMIRDSRAADPRFQAAFAVTSRGSGQPVGMANHHDRRPVYRRLAVGWILIRSWQHQGIMREAAPAPLNHCFGHLDTHRIEAGNTPSVRLAEWPGFEREGLMRDWMFVAGEARSPCLHPLSRHDWDARGAPVTAVRSG